MEISDDELIFALIEYEDRELTEMLDERELIECLNEYEEAHNLPDAQHDEEMREANAPPEPPQVGGGDVSLYRIVRTEERHNSKFDIIDRTIHVVWSSLTTSFNNATDQVNALFQQIYDDYVRDLSGNFKVRIVVDHDLLESPVSTHIIDKKQFTPALIASIFENTLQSRKSTLLEAMQPNYNMKINLSICSVIKGGHRGASEQVADNRERCEVVDLDTFCKNSKFITVLKNSKYCLVQAIVIEKALYDGEANANKLKMHPKILYVKVMKIVNDLRLPNEDLGVAYSKNRVNAFAYGMNKLAVRFS
jgi:hypothetical protein